MSQPIRVLLVEDNPGDADLTRETLEQSKVHVDIAVAIDGAQAIDYLKRQPPFENVDAPDLVLLDLNLPKMDGRQVLAEVRRHPDTHSLPVVILTSSDAEQDVVRSYQLGANAYVTKPVGLAEFQSIVRAVENFWFTIVKLP